MNLLKLLSTFLILSYLSGCATGSVRMIGNAATYKSGSCEVTVYQTKNQAIENGMTKEICIVEGSSAFSFDHSTEGAIKNNISKLCQCGVKSAYIESAHIESQMGMKEISYINLVGFK
ncbi:hypothetical protein [Vogesella sp. EB]|uniref:hypothetical protein n=1 Tax=Vogesella sp. EB TaxID=1526735 RepID=UPI0012DFFDAB|nr:hypothetical protein [Vogesella sp. EB]